MKYLGLDIGSSFIKGAVLDLDRLAIEHVTRRPFPGPQAGLPPGQFEIEPREVAAQAEGLLQELWGLTPDCQGVLLTGQMGGVLLLDERGAPLTNYLSWRDERTTRPHPAGGSFLDVAKEKLRGTAVQENDNVLARVGNEFRAGSAAALLFWLVETGQLPPQACPVSLGDFVVSRLCQAAPVMEPTQALGTLDLCRERPLPAHRDSESGPNTVLDDSRNATEGVPYRAAEPAAGAFSLLLQERLGLANLAWPELRSVCEPAGTWRIGGLEIPCYPVVGDHQCALAGTLLAEGELSINVSTGSQVSLLTRELTLGGYQTRPYFNGRFLNTITHLPAGRSLEVLVSLLSELATSEGVRLKQVWPNILRAATEAADSDLAVDLAFFAGTMGNRGSIANISTENLTLGSLFRAAFRSMAENYGLCAARLSPERSWRRIVFSGGLAQHLDLLREFIIERIGSEARLSANTEDTLLGLLMLGLVISGQARDLAEAGEIYAGNSKRS